MALKRSITVMVLYLLITNSGLLLLAACGFLPIERVDYKAYPTAEDPNDFYGRVYARTRTEEVIVQQADSAQKASQGVGFTIRLPAYLPEDLEPIDKFVISQAHAYQVNVDLNIASALLESAYIPVNALSTSKGQFTIDAIVPPSALTSQGSDPRFVTFIQTTNPAVGSTSGVDPALLDTLGVLGWQYLGLTEQQAEQISQDMSWASFLALPPVDMKSATIVEINGISDIALQSGENDDPNRAIFWADNGVLYGVYSNLPLSELQAIAGSLE